MIVFHPSSCRCYRSFCILIFRVTFVLNLLILYVWTDAPHESIPFLTIILYILPMPFFTHSTGNFCSFDCFSIFPTTWKESTKNHLPNWIFSIYLLGKWHSSSFSSIAKLRLKPKLLFIADGTVALVVSVLLSQSTSVASHLASCIVKCTHRFYFFSLYLH